MSCKDFLIVNNMRGKGLNKLIDSKQSSVHWMDKTVLGKELRFNL